MTLSWMIPLGLAAHFVGAGFTYRLLRSYSYRDVKSLDELWDDEGSLPCMAFCLGAWPLIWLVGTLMWVGARAAIVLNEWLMKRILRQREQAEAAKK